MERNYVQNRPLFIFWITLSPKLTDLNDFGTLNPEKILHENLTDLSTSPVTCSHFTLGNPKKVILNSITHTYFWLFTLSQKKTICNPLAHPTWKCYHMNLWIAKLLHLTEGLLRSFKRWRIWREPVLDCFGGSGNNRLWCVATGMSGKQCHVQQVFTVAIIYINTYFQSSSTLISRTVHHAVL